MLFWLKDLAQPSKGVAYLKRLVLLAPITTLRRVCRTRWNLGTELRKTGPLTGRAEVRVTQVCPRLCFTGWSPNYVLSPRSMFSHFKVSVAFFVICWIWSLSVFVSYMNWQRARVFPLYQHFFSLDFQFILPRPWDLGWAILSFRWRWTVKLTTNPKRDTSQPMEGLCGHTHRPNFLWFRSVFCSHLCSSSSTSTSEKRLISILFLWIFP